MPHQCQRCLGNHPVTSCPHKEIPQPGFLKTGKGGKGKKGKGARPPGRDELDQQSVHVEQPPTTLEADAENSTKQDNTASRMAGEKILYLFGGPLRPDDGLGRFLMDLGYECDYVDLEVNAMHDFLD